MATDINPLQTAIPLGRGRGVKEVYHFGMFLRFIDKKGKEINPWPNGNDFVDPRTDPNFDHIEPLAFQAGKLANLPFWDEETMREILAADDFARPGMLEKIQGWIEKDGLESHDLIAKVKEEKGLVTLKDFGFEEAQTPTQEQPQPGG